MSNSHLIPAVPPFPIFSASAALTATTGIAAAITAAVLAETSKMQHLPLAVTTAVACLLTALLGQLPVRVLSTRYVEGAGLGFVAGTVLRIGLTLLAAFAISSALEIDLVATAIWTTGWYLLLLMVEVILLTRYLASRQTILNAKVDLRCPRTS